MSISIRFFLPLVLITFLLSSPSLKAQQGQSTSKTNKETSISTNWAIKDLTRRSNDHFMFQFGYISWINAPDSIRLDGFHHYFNFTFFYDIPFKSNPRFSVAPGIGFTLNRVFFDKVDPLIAVPGSTLNFKDVSNSDRADIQGLFYHNLEAQVEFRYISNPKRSERSFKMALGLKIGLTFDAFNHKVNLSDKEGKAITTGITDQHNTRFFDFPATVVSFRIGYGVIGLSASYQLNSLFKASSKAPEVNPISFGLVLSGL